VSLGIVSRKLKENKWKSIAFHFKIFTKLTLLALIS